VHEIKLEPIQLVIDLPRKVYYRGEKIEGTVTLKYYYGTPLPNRSLQYRLSNGRVHTATTDAKGQVKFSFETTAFNESQQLAVTATYAERNIGAATPVFIATRGFAVQVTTRRGTYIAGETFDATVKLADPAGKPVAKDLKLEVFQLLPAAPATGGKGEKLVSTYAIKSDKEKGEARQTLRIDKAGYYRIRATGTDRFGNPVSGQHVVKISGDDDRVRLRILADKHSFKVGDTAKVQLHWREAPALALVTFEGAKVLGYQLVTLKKGANALALPMVAKFAPNFVLSVAVMEKNRFHQARSEFLVSRKLTIALKPAKTTFKPGDELKVEITTTDPQGKPVSAELSLGLIQKNLLDRFGERQGVVDAFFGGGYRVPSVRAFTSATFRYRPRTRGISKYLLAEAERRQILQAELKVRELMAIQQVRDLERMAKQEASQRLLEKFPRGGTIVGLAAPDAFTGDLDVQFQRGVFENAESISRSSVNLRPGDRGSAQIPGYWKELSKDRKKWSSVDLHGRQQRGQAPRPGQGFGGLGGRFGGGGIGGFEGGGFGGQQAGNSPAKRGGENDGGFHFYLGLDRDAAQPNDKNDPKRILSQMNRLVIRGGKDSVQRLETTLSLIINQTDTPMMKSLAELRDGTIVALADNGEYQVVNGISVKKLQDLTKNGLRVLPAMAAAETGYWNPLVVTGKDGKAVVTFRLPNRSTAWKLRAKGTDAGVLTGQAEADVISKKDLFGEVKTPLAFYRGDKASVLVEVHNGVVKKGDKIAVELAATIGNRTTKTAKTVTSTGPGIAEVAFPVEITEGETAEFKLTVTAGKQTDTSTAVVPVRAFGLPVFATASGSSAQNTIAFVTHDKRLDVQDTTMEILIGPSINRTLLDAVLGGGATRCESRFVSPGSSIERTVSDAIGGVSLLKMIRATRNTNTPEAQALTGRVQAAIAALVSLQRGDGGWSWSGRASAASHRFLSSRAVWALAAARKSGFAVPEDTFNKAVQYLRTQFTKSSTNDREGQAILLHGLAQAGAADFAFANRLYRERNVLSPSGLVHVALVLIELDRKQMADALLKLVKLPADAKIANRQLADSALSKVAPWMRSSVELRALYLLALQAVTPADKRVGPLADWLLAARHGSRWRPEKANGPAIAALAEWFARAKFVSEKYTLNVIVNGGLVKKIEVDPSKDGSRRLQVPAKLLVKGKGKQQKITFDMTGRGRFSYSVVLGGFVPAEKLKNTTADWKIARHYEPAARMFDGKPVPRGFGILTAEHQRTKRFRNPLTQLPLGERGEVTLRLTRSGNAPRRDGEREYLVITEPIPAGCSVASDSITGGFERYEILPGAITFYVGERASVADIRYTLVGYLPGTFRAAPTVARSFYQPSRIAVAGIKPLDTLARGEKSKDKYRLSPVELFELGKRYAGKRQFKEADKHLTQLFSNYGLRQSVFGEVVKLLFRTSLEVKNDAAIVEFFEIIKERYPEEVINFDEILQTADAYRKLGEYERAYLVFRSTIEASFERESQIAGFLDDRGEFLRSVQIMEELLADYPAESYVATATYALAQEVYGKSAEVAGNKKLRDRGLTKADLIGANVKMLDHFLSTWPKDPAVDQAAFAMANSYLDLEDYKGAAARCEKFAQRYPKSKLLDSFWYVIGYSRFALGRHDDALKMCRKVAETKRRDPDTGVEVAAANKWQAIYIMGQVYHSLGKPANAITEYTRVKNRFPDAKQSIEFFTRKAIKLPEVSTIKPGDAAKVTLDFRNVATANVKVYRIDLLKFGLMQRNLNRITAINLAGIRPFHELTLNLGDGKDFRD
ncbi:MAG: alpha-2-macroglobulin family protein, partial [Planctomycetaceae bacterium]